MRGALGFSVLRFWIFFWIGFSVFVPKNFGFQFWCSLRFADFPFFSIWFSVFAKNTNGFSDLISDAVFGFSYFTYLGSGFSSIWAAIGRLHAPLISNSRQTQMLTRGMRDKPIKISQGSHPPPSPKVGGEGRVRLHIRYGFFINATSKLVTKLQATCDLLIQHFNRISKLSGPSSQMEMLD